MTMYSPGLNSDVIEQATLVPFAYDTILADYAGSNFDVYTYKQGGTTVATVTVTWTTTSKEVLSTVART